MATALPAEVYQSVNPAVLQRVPRAARRLLDVGCGGGAFGAAVKAQQRCSVVGLTHSQAEASTAARALDEVRVVDLEHYALPADTGGQGGQRYDCIVCSHVLEHLAQPQRLLRVLKHELAPGGTLIVALPNALFWRQRMQFVRGRFRYTDGGLMDRTHLRFFDWETAAELVSGAGFMLHERHADGGFPLSRRLGRALGSRLDDFARRRHPGLFGSQFVISAQAAGDPTSASAAAA